MWPTDGVHNTTLNTDGKIWNDSSVLSLRQTKHIHQVRALNLLYKVCKDWVVCRKNAQLGHSSASSVSVSLCSALKPVQFLHASHAHTCARETVHIGRNEIKEGVLSVKIAGVLILGVNEFVALGQALNSVFAN